MNYRNADGTPLDDETLTRAVYEYFGKASHLAAHLEWSLIVSVSFLQTLQSRDASPELAALNQAANTGHPAGVVVQRFRPFLVDEPGLIRHLEAYLGERALLSHDFFTARIPEFNERATREKMLAQVLAAREVFEAADADLSRFLVGYLEPFGITPDVMAAANATHVATELDSEQRSTTNR
jgi:hypothetical protein